MKMRGRNRKWLRAGNRRTVWVVRVDVVFQFSAGVPHVGGGVDTFVVINVVERRTQVSHHGCVRSKYRGRSRRGSVNGKEGVDSRELAVDFFFLDIEEVGNVFDHLFVRKGQVTAGGAVWRGRGNEVRSVASAVNGRRRVGRDEDGRRRAGHRWNGWAVVWCRDSLLFRIVVERRRSI